MAATATTLALPLASSRRYRAQSLTCAFHAVSRTALGWAWIRSCRVRLIRAGMR
jgi:hypothetical protein